MIIVLSKTVLVVLDFMFMMIILWILLLWLFFFIFQNENTILCHLKFLETNPTEGFMWSSLGHLYSQKSPSLASQANFCFKQAAKLTAKNSLAVSEWHFIGPFVIGKMELDGDPLEAFGGIQNVSLYRLNKKVKYLSFFFFAFFFWLFLWLVGKDEWMCLSFGRKGKVNVCICLLLIQ